MSEARSTTDDRFKVVVAMLNEDPKLYERVKLYMNEPSTKPKKERKSSIGEGLLSLASGDFLRPDKAHACDGREQSGYLVDNNTCMIICPGKL